MNNKVQCPKCKNLFNIDEILNLEYEKKYREEYAVKELRLQLEIKEFEEKKSKANDLFQKKLNQKISEEIQSKEEAIRIELEKQMIDKYETLLNQKVKKEQENENLKQKEIQLIKDKIDLENRIRNFDYEKKKLEMEIEQKTKRNLEQVLKKQQEEFIEESMLQIRERDKKLKEQEKAIEEINRKIKQGSINTQGEVQELALEEFLKNSFPADIVEEVGKGVKGADVIQTVFNSMQKNCGKIIYESKKTQNFSLDWIDKLKMDQTAQEASLAILVTQTMPKDMPYFGYKDGVWICTFRELKIFAGFIREALIRENRIKLNNQNIDDKKQRLYDYLISDRFILRISNIVHGFTKQKEDLEKEKKTFQKLWKTREEEIDFIIQNTIEMYGSIQGIGGSVIPQIKSLEFPDIDESI